MTINGESAASALVVAEYLQQTLLNENALDIAGLVAKMDAVIYANNSIKSAFDMALYDIAAKHAGQPLYRFLGGDGRSNIRTDYTVSVGDPTQMAQAARDIVANGFEIIKVKLGKGGAEDVVRMQAIRSAVGNQMPIRIDANQGWQPQEAVETLQAMAGLNIQHCEEPIARWNFLELPAVRQASPIPIMADESCCDANDARRLVALNACDMFNIKLGKSGGIYKALQIVKVAEENNMKVQVGAFLESRLAMSAFAHFATISPAIQFYDFDTALMFTSDPIAGGITYHAGGKIMLPANGEAPGIGAEPAFAF